MKQQPWINAYENWNVDTGIGLWSAGQSPDR